MGAAVETDVLVIGQGFDDVHIDSESLVASQELVEGLHQLLLQSSHIRFFSIKKQDHEAILVLTHWDTTVAHRLGNKHTKVNCLIFKFKSPHPHTQSNHQPIP